MHEEEIKDCLNLMLESIDLIEMRFQKIGSPDDFGISFRIITIRSIMK